MKKKTWIWIGSIAGVLLLAGGVLLAVKIQAAKTAGAQEEEVPLTVQKAAEQELSESILVTGKIVPESEQKVYIEAERGEIQEFKVKENDKVKAGDPLIVYDSSKLRSEYSKAVRERDLIQKRLQTEINQTAELGKMIASAEEGVEELKKEKIELEMQQENTKSEIESAQEAINDLTEQINEMTVASKVDGVVVKVDPNAAASEGAAGLAVHVVSGKPFKVIGTMSEFDTVKIKEKQQVIIRPKVFKEREWKGVIESVSQFPNEEGGGDEFAGDAGGGNVTMYPFKVGVTDDTSELRQGFHVSMEIKIDGDGKKLSVPYTAVLDEDETSIVYVLKDGVVERREVETGASNDEFIEVKKGVKKGELVVTMPEDAFEGMEVTSFDEIE